MKWLIAAVLGLALLGGCGRGGDDEVQILHVGSQRGGTKAVMLASGVLKGAPYKIEWSEFPAAQNLLEAIGGNAVDVGLAGDAPFMFAYQSGSRIRAIGAQHLEHRPLGQLALVVPSNSEAQTLADLKDKKVATTRGSIGHYLVIRALLDAKLPSDWVKLTFLSPGDAKAAFDSGSIDAWATWAPYLSVALKGHGRTIVDGQNLDLYGFDVANDDAIAAKGPLLRDFLQREAKALRWAAGHIDDYAKLLSQETGLPLDIARDYAAKNIRQAVPIDDLLITKQYQVLSDFKAAGSVEGKRDLTAAFDKRFSKTEVAAAQ